MEANEQEPTPAPTPHDHAPTPGSSAFLWGGLILGVLLVVLLVTHGFGLWAKRGGGPEESPLVHQGTKVFIPESSPLRHELTVMAVAAEPLNPMFTAPGLVESDPVRTVTVLPAGGGRVRAVKVALGDRVKRGQALVIIDSPDLAQAYDDNDKAESAARLAAQNLKYQEAQFKIGAASQRDLDQARDSNTEAVAEYTRTRAHLRAMGAPENARGAAARLLTVRAPMDGAVTTLSTAPGATINDDTQPILSVADLSVVWVTAFVAEKDVASVARNDDAEVRIDAYPARTLHGKVLFVSPVIEPDSRRNKTRIAFDNPDYDLKPNMFANVTLRGPARSRVVVPATALLMNNDRTSVFVETAPWTFERRTVEPLLQESTQVAILSGLQPGEKVIVGGGILIND